MSKIARRLAALGLAATMVGSLAACGGNSSDSQTADGGNNITCLLYTSPSPRD